MQSGWLMHSDCIIRTRMEKVGHTCQSVSVARNVKQNNAEARKDGKEQKRQREAFVFEEKMARELLVSVWRFHPERKDKPTEIQFC